MPEGTSNSVVNLGDLTKPADTLIKKVSKAVGGLFAPYQIKRLAKADAEAAIIKAETDIEITDLRRRAMHRFIDEESQRQKNIEDITAKALPQLTNASDPDSMEDDWVTNFFDKCRIVSDEQMQQLWSRILAGEANAPGSFSRRTVNFLSDLDKMDSELFEKLCGFVWSVAGFVPLIFDTQAEIYRRNDIGFASLIHLESIGLIQFNHLSGFRRLKLPKRFQLEYHGRILQMEMQKEEDNELQLGHALLTRVGEQLATICASPAVDGFFEYVQTQWSAHLLKEPPEQISPVPPAAQVI
jgi:hypothetical protein